MRDDGDHILYRLVDSRRRLMYVGITLNPVARLRRHREEKDWWWAVAEIYLERFGSRELLMRAEREAIRVERPRFNIMGSDGCDDDPEAFDVLPCPACGIDAFYRRSMGRYYHLDGSDNIDCWCACTRGDAGFGLTNVFGREIPISLEFENSAEIQNYIKAMSFRG